MANRLDCPPQLWRVIADIGFGWPDHTRTERKRRFYMYATDAARWIANIRALPSHHSLVAVYVTVGWERDDGIIWIEADMAHIDGLVAELATTTVDTDDGYDD